MKENVQENRKIVSNITIERVRFADTDSFGIVYYASYLKWIEIARTEFFRKYLGKGPKDFEKSNIAFPFININITFKQTAEIDDELIVNSQLQSFGKSSIKMVFTISNKSGKTLCQAETVTVCVNYDREKIDVPETFRKILEQ